MTSNGMSFDDTSRRDMSLDDMSWGWFFQGNESRKNRESPLGKQTCRFFYIIDSFLKNRMHSYKFIVLFLVKTK